MDLIKYMNKSVSNIVVEALKMSFTKPSTILFLLRFKKSIGNAEKMRAEYLKNGTHIPPFLIASITNNCNLFCKGCYAKAESFCKATDSEQLTEERWGELFSEAEKLGICFILLAGGEPFMRREVLNEAVKHQNILFPVFTNGVLIEGENLALLNDNRNLVPIISLEGEKEATDIRRGDGVYEKVLEAMAKLKRKGILFGVSVTVTKNNVNDVTKDEFVKKLKENGANVIFYIEYIPVDLKTRELAPTDVERAILEKNTERLREKHKMMMISFPGDEKYSGGCLAAGRGFVHINSNGSVEPCPFSPYSDISAKNNSLLECLKSPFLTKLREEGFLLGEHDGGCLLFEKEVEVKKMLRND